MPQQSDVLFLIN